MGRSKIKKVILIVLAIAWVSFWYSQETKTGSMFLTVADSGETCLMGYGMKWEFDTDALLDIVNESFAEGNESTVVWTWVQYPAPPPILDRPIRGRNRIDQLCEKSYWREVVERLKI